MTPTSANPASRTIERFGGITRCARALSKPKSTVQRWKDSGFIHPDYYPEILAAAVAEQVQLDPTDFNLVDVRHPAFSAASNPSPDNTADRGPGSSCGPNSQTPESPSLAGGVDRAASAEVSG